MPLKAGIICVYKVTAVCHRLKDSAIKVAPGSTAHFLCVFWHFADPEK